MTFDQALSAVVKTLEKVQNLSGLPCPTLKGEDVPKKVLEQFDSTVWPVATSWIARELGIKIDNDVHIFGGKDRGKLLTIQETAAIIFAKCKPIEANEENEENYAVAAE